MNNATSDRAAALLAQSLAAWRLDGVVAREGDGAILVRADGKEIHVARGAADIPFRWMVTIGGRRRGAISLVAVLRQVRSALDEDFVPNRVRVALAPWRPS